MDCGRRDTRIRRLRRDELPVDTIELARYLIGKILVHDLPEGRTSGRIVETEAYPIGDPACHAYRGLTASNRSLFLDRGHVYVYFIYGSSFCANVSSETPGVGAGVLLRGLEPIEGVPTMEKRRRTNRLRELTRGPGRLAEAMGIDRRCDGLDLCGDEALWLGSVEGETAEIGTTTRIGLSREAHRPLRFHAIGSQFVSGPRRLLVAEITKSRPLPATPRL